MDYLLNQSKDANVDAVKHGACLGLGLAAMGTAREDIYEQLKLNLFQDDAVTGLSSYFCTIWLIELIIFTPSLNSSGEAAGIAMGLVMLGTGSVAASADMVTYAQDTQHEKIMRGLALGIALTYYGQLEDADKIIEQLSNDKDSILRWIFRLTIHSLNITDVVWHFFINIYWI